MLSSKVHVMSLHNEEADTTVIVSYNDVTSVIAQMVDSDKNYISNDDSDVDDIVSVTDDKTTENLLLVNGPTNNGMADDGVASDSVTIDFGSNSVSNTIANVCVVNDSVLSDGILNNDDADSVTNDLDVNDDVAKDRRAERELTMSEMVTITYDITGSKCRICNFCGKTFYAAQQLRLHLNMHLGVKYKCDICEKTFCRETTLAKHIKTHTREGLFSCDMCSRQFTSNAALKRHKLRHESKNLKRSSDDAADHAIDVLSANEPLCNFCGKTFKRRANLKLHMKRHGHGKELTCKVCGEAFTVLSKLIIHEKMHKGFHPWTCHICGKTFLEGGKLDAHLRAHNGEKVFFCHLCDKTFSQRAGLNQHQNTKHGGAPSFTCEQCGESFFLKHKLTEHFRLHTGEKPYTCDICFMSFRTAKLIRNHKILHRKGTSSHDAVKNVDADASKQGPPGVEPAKNRHTVKSQNLDIHTDSMNFLNSSINISSEDNPSISLDSADFTKVNGSAMASFESVLSNSNNNLNKPNDPQKLQTEKTSKRQNILHDDAVHIVPDKWKCDKCDKTFKYPAYLESHRRVHRQDKTYFCAPCNRKFRSLSALRGHQAHHVGENEDNTCNVCRNSFPNRQSLRNHSRVHREVFSCGVCWTNFSETSLLVAHMDKHK